MTHQGATSINGAINKLFSREIEAYIKSFKTYNKWFLKQTFADYKRNLKLDHQKVSLVQHQELGPDLAVSNFVLNFGGKVRDNKDRWIAKVDHLPKEYNKNYKLTYVDASKCGLLTEAIDNFIGLVNLESLDLSDNHDLDDFACDQLARQFRNSTKLKEINMSNNPQITINGLNILMRVKSLQKISAINTLASSHNQIDVFKVAADCERSCHVMT